MSDHLHLEEARRKNIRWRILKVCDTSRGIAVNEQLMLSILTDVDLNVSPNELRREASYLESKDLIKINKEKGRQAFEITSDGTELVQYDAPCPDSIGRPPRYF